jgi:hypothetical protein
MHNRRCWARNDSVKIVFANAQSAENSRKFATFLGEILFYMNLCTGMEHIEYIRLFCTIL